MVTNDSISNSNTIVKSCKPDLSKYFHSEDIELNNKFRFIYKLFGLNDEKLAVVVGIDKSTMSRYRRGIFVPTSNMKIIIAQSLSKIAGYQIDSSIIWGESIFFEKFRRERK